MERKYIEKNIVDYMLSYNPTLIGIFGSYARGEETVTSDIDIMVRFKETPSLLQLIKMENELRSKLGITVDLVTENAIQNTIVKKIYFTIFKSFIMHKVDLAYLNLLMLCIAKIKKYMSDVTKSDFRNNELMQDAVIRTIVIIAEASKNHCVKNKCN